MKLTMIFYNKILDRILKWKLN